MVGSSPNKPLGGSKWVLLSEYQTMATLATIQPSEPVLFTVLPQHMALKTEPMTQRSPHIAISQPAS